MKKTRWMAIAAATFLIGAPMLEAEAKRLGGGTSIGRTAPSSGTKSATATPAKPAQPQAAPAPTAPQPAAAKSSWMGPLAGIAAGLGLAALASYLGLGEEFMSLMLIMLAVVAVFAVFRIIAARRQAQSGGYGQPAMAKSGYGGNELGGEARPGNVTWPASTGGRSGAGSENVEPVFTPESAPAEISQEEIDQFMKVAREQFTRLQAIWDSGDIHALAEFCTSEMTRELSHQIAARKGESNVTQVVRLDAQWLGMTESLDDFGKPVDEVQVRFSGLIREGTEVAAADFNEAWTLHRPKSGGGWLLAGITQLS